MSQDNIQGDTPVSNEGFTSLEEAVFNSGEDTGSQTNISDIFTTKTGDEGTQAAPEKGQPVTGNQEDIQVETGPNNDEKRFEYWQSRADKIANENAALKEQVKQQSMAMQQQAPVQQNVEAPVREEFPPAPLKPEKPRVFNREEAYADPNSESARYLDEVDGWRDNMSEYNALKNQYQNAILAEKVGSYEQERIEDVKRAQVQQTQMQQKNEVANYVMGHHGLNQNEASDFISTMSDPSSVSLDNLVQLYRLNNGGGTQQNNPSAPSQEFQQLKNAQQVPSPMGVMPSGQSNSSNESMEDKMMDKMIGDFNSKNPW